MDIASLMGAGAGGGWAKVGQALGGIGGAGEEKAYDAALARQHDLERKLAEARIKRDEALQREQLTGNLEGLVKDPATAQALSSVMRAGFGNFDQATQGAGNLIENDARRGALDAAMRGDTDTANRLISVGKGEPLKVRDIEAGQEYSPYLANGIPTTVTPVGQAEIARDLAAGAASRASAARSTAAIDNDAARVDVLVNKEAERLIKLIEKENKTTLDQAQRSAIYNAVRNGDDLNLEFPPSAKPATQSGPSIADAMLGQSGGNANASSTPAPNRNASGISPIATRVPGARRDPYRPKTPRGADFQAAQAAIEAGKSYDAVVKRMVEAGYPDAATILKRKR
jgi:hypothetical protein